MQTETQFNKPRATSLNKVLDKFSENPRTIYTATAIANELSMNKETVKACVYFLVNAEFIMEVQGSEPGYYKLRSTNQDKA